MTIAEKLTTIAQNVPKVYKAGEDEGYRKGHEEGHSNGYDDGYIKGHSEGWEEGNSEGWINGRAEFYNEFWDSYLGLTSFVNMFSGRMWNDTTFKPKYDFRVQGQANAMFYNNGCSNIKKTLEDCGVRLDLSQATQANQIFYYCYSLELPEIDLSSATSVQGTFQDARRLETIDKVTFKDDVTFRNTFSNIPTLKNLTIGGTIGGSGFDVSSCKGLTKQSITSIIDALSKSKSGLSITLSKEAVNNAFGINVDDATTFPEGSEYYNLRHSKDNWTINYL